MDKSKVLIRLVDDDEVILRSVSVMLRYEGYRVQSWTSGRQYLREDFPSYPGCLVLDIKMPGMTGIELQEELTQRDIRIPVVFLTGHGDVDIAVNSMKMGAFDFLQKPLNPERFLKVVEAACEFDLNRKGLDFDVDAAALQWQRLTESERRIVALLVKGCSARLVAERLGISKRTVETHKSNIYKKLSLHSTEQLVMLAEILSKSESKELSH